MTLGLASTASAQEYRFYLNYDFGTGEPFASNGGGGGASDPETTDPETSEPITTDPGDPTVWRQYANDNGLHKMLDTYYGWSSVGGRYEKSQ